MDQTLANADACLEKSGEELPFVVRTSTVSIDGISLTVHQLSNGQRVIEAESMDRFMRSIVDRSDDAKSTDASMNQI